jgi:hypothetical protein
MTPFSSNLTSFYAALQAHARERTRVNNIVTAALKTSGTLRVLQDVVNRRRLSATEEAIASELLVDAERLLEVEMRLADSRKIVSVIDTAAAKIASVEDLRVLMKQRLGSRGQNCLDRVIHVCAPDFTAPPLQMPVAGQTMMAGASGAEDRREAQIEAVPVGLSLTLEQALVSHLCSKGFDEATLAMVPAIAEAVRAESGKRHPDQSLLVIHKTGFAVATLTSERSRRAVVTAGDSVLSMALLERIVQAGMSLVISSALRRLCPEATSGQSDLDLYALFPVDVVQRAESEGFPFEAARRLLVDVAPEQGLFVMKRLLLSLPAEEPRVTLFPTSS